MSDNPLKSHLRIPKIYVNLPSQGFFYNDLETCEITNEVPIKAMTATDEMMLSTPDALINGESIISVFKSCCPMVKNPLDMTISDVDLIFIAIQYASFGDSVDINAKCPNCNTDNEYQLSLGNMIQSVTYNEKEYPLVISKELKVYCKPNSFKTVIMMSLKSIEAANIVRNLKEEDLQDVETAIKYSTEFKKMVNMNVSILLDGIQKVEIRNEHGTTVINSSEHITEWLNDINKETSDKIKETIDKANDVGIVRKMPFTCGECKHEWENEVDLNPVSFFTKGS